jgi:hypothetical protein
MYFIREELNAGKGKFSALIFQWFMLDGIAIQRNL